MLLSLIHILFNNTKERLDGVAVAAQYSGGTMLDVKMEEFSVEQRSDTRLTLAFDEYAERLRVFLFRDMDSLKPVSYTHLI